MQTLHPEAAREAQQLNLPRYTTVLDTPIGPIALVQRGEHLCEARLHGDVQQGETLNDTPLLQQAKQQLTEYFAHKRTVFDLPLAPLGTPFQTLVWEQLTATVPFGQSVSYGELARRCDKPLAARAVGMANNRNPLPIFIPCHRVIGGDRSLVGYGGGLSIKRYLLALEKVPFKG